MTKTEEFVRGIFEKSGKGFAPFISAIDLTAELLFKENRPVEDILVTKDIYPQVAKRLHMKGSAASRQILRTANRCWDRLNDEQKEKYIGRVFPILDAPRDLLFYFAVYLYGGKPFYAMA